VVRLKENNFRNRLQLNNEKYFSGRELGSGQFGIVWLADAIGISAFRPRDMLREREGGRRFSFFNRTRKRNSYVFCKEVTQVAVKTMKGLILKFSTVPECMIQDYFLYIFKKLLAKNSFVVRKFETYSF
jgi:hypothetical protein